MGVKLVLIISVIVILISGGSYSLFFSNKDSSKIDILDEKNNNFYNETNNNISYEDNLSINDSKFDYRIINLKIILNETSKILVKDNRVLNIGENLSSVSGHILDKDFITNYFKEEGNFDYLHWVRLEENLTLERFNDSEIAYGNYTTGFALDSRDKILDYTLAFDYHMTFEEFLASEIFIFGKKYFVSRSSNNLEKISLLELPYSFYLNENENILINYPETKINFSIDFLNKEKLVLIIDGNRSNSLYEGDYFYNGKVYIYLKEILYSSKYLDSKIGLVISPKEITFFGSKIFYNETEIDELEYELSPDDDEIKKLKFSWILDDDYDLVNDEVLSLPYFQNFNFSISGVKYDDSRTKYVDVYLTNEVSELVEISST